MNRGFTLMEMIVSVVVFVFVVSAAAGLLVNGLKAQRRSLAYQELIDQVSFAVEDMSRSARMAKKELFGHAYDCLSARGMNYESPAPSRLRFIKYDHDVEADVCHEFFLEDGQLKESKKNLITGAETTQPLTSAGLQINTLIFGVAGADQEDDRQPLITFFLDIQSAGQKEEERISLQMQSSVSQRNLDIKR